MKANETTFRKLIQGERQFLVPLYQRPYAWGVTQLGQLWNDLTALADRPGSLHFLGSVVLAPSPEMTPSTLTQWIVVDGQQRLTTLFLALSAIRDHQSAEDPKHRERIDELHLINKWQQGDLRFRLLPTQTDRAAFIACIESDLDGSVTGTPVTAYQFFRSKLLAVDDPMDPHDIARIEAALLDQLSLVEIVVEKDDNAFRIFESINNTGMRLNQVDLIRNYVFMCLPTRGDEVYRKYWLPMQKRLSDRFGMKALDDLMTLVLVLKGDATIKSTDVYRGHQEILDRIGHDEAAIEAYVAELARRAKHLELILDPPEHEDPRIADVLRFLDGWEAKTAYPTIMRLIELREEGDATDDDVYESLRYIESFLVRRLLSVVPTNNLNRVFAAVTQALNRDESAPETVRHELSTGQRHWVDDASLREAIRTRPFYIQGRSGQKKLVLRRLEDSYGSKEKVDLKPTTIEHVLPQHLTESWRQQLSSHGDDPQAVHNQLVHTLGNLTLTGYNSELGDLPFQEKRKRLIATSIGMSQAIGEQPRWGRAEILARADDLAERAIGLWPGPLENTEPEVPGRDWTLLHKALMVLPPGTWTTYGEVAELIGTAPAPVGAHLAYVPVRNAHRVLSADRRPSSGFRWVEENDTRDVREVLIAEGVKFDEAGRADPAQCISARELAQLLDLPGAEDLADLELADVDAEEMSESELRFYAQLSELCGPTVAGATTRIIEHWNTGVGTLHFGSANTGRCQLRLRHAGVNYSILNIYPQVGEIPFQVLKNRPPFDDATLREELRQRINDAPGVDIPETKLGLYPTFPLIALADPAAWDVVAGTLDWFISQVNHTR